MGVAIVGLVVSTIPGLSCAPANTPPQTMPVAPSTPGYLRTYDYDLGLGFDYPEDWETEVPQFGPPFEKVEVFTKAGEQTRIVISVHTTWFGSLAEVKGFGYIDRQSISRDGFVVVNDRQAYEVAFTQHPDKRAKWVIFLVNDREYRIECYSTEELYPAREEVFDHVIASFVIE